MLYLVNPAKRPRKKVAKKRRVSRKRPTAKQLAARKKFAAMAKARAKAAKTRKRATKGVSKMATRRKRARKRVTARRRAPSRRRSVAARPRRRTARRTTRRTVRRYRRNPPRMAGIVNQVMDLAKNSGAALVGMAAGRTVSNLIPIGAPTDPIMNFAKGAVAAIAIRTLGARFVGAEVARFAAVGAMLGPVKDLVVSFVPQAEAFLGRSDSVMYLPPMVANRLSSYSSDPINGGVMEDGGMGSYSHEGFGY